MKTSDFNYYLPEELIAQTPVEPRDASRLMTLDKKTGAVAHHHFYEIIDFLNPGDCLILNDSRVLPARLYGIKEDTGARVEFCFWKTREMIFGRLFRSPGSGLKRELDLFLGKV